MGSKDEFAEKLQQLAKEQQSLVEHSMMPNWLGPINASIARNALPVVISISLVISLVLFSVFFDFFYVLEGRLI